MWLKKAAIPAVIILAVLCLFSGCNNEKNNNNGGDFTVSTDESRALYVAQYSDFEARNAWVKKNIEQTNVPPVSFSIDGISSRDLDWKKNVGEQTEVTDFAEEAPSSRLVREITYTCKDKNIKIVLTETSYPGYAVAEYDAMLYNTSDKASGLIEDMFAIDTVIDSYDGVDILHGNKGSTCSYGDFSPFSATLTVGKKKMLSETSGKPTKEYIPYFDAENVENNTGTIGILNWQGTWKVTFEKKAEGLSMTAGQSEVSCNLKAGEYMRYPGIVLLFYKGDYTKGQNVYRRWIYECNLFRYQEQHMESTNALICPSADTEKGDLAEIQFYARNGVLEYLDKINKDAGWYEREGRDWTYTGNWYFDEDIYPNGLKALSEEAHKNGLPFAVWFEPERIIAGTQMAQDLKGKMIAPSGDDSTAPKGTTLLTNYADEDAVNYTIEMLDRIITEQGIDQYRQDFNMDPGPYWTVQDNVETAQLGLARKGVTENHYTTGYLKVFSELVKRHPGMYIDACASGGMRYDLETMRYSFLHTRSDYWADIESAQSQTYGSAMWFLYWGTGFTDLSSYDVRSHIGNSIGVGASTKTQAEALKTALTEWRYTAQYLFYDYYPLTDFAGSSKRPMAIQFDSPEDGKGMFMTYFRSAAETVICPQGLDPAATYIIWNYDDKENTQKTMTGAEIMAGISISSTASSAVFYEYVLAEGQDTTAFRTASVKTGKGSTSYVAPAEAEVKNGYPTLSEARFSNTLSDEQLKSMYKISGDDKIEFVTADSKSSGFIYAISKNIFEEIYTTSKTLDGWIAVNKNKLSIDNYPFTTWDNGIFINQPYIKQIDDTYFLWLSSIIGFSDADGGWKDHTVTFKWSKKSGGTGSAKVTSFTIEYAKHQKINYFSDTLMGTYGRCYKVTEEIFNSFAYTGEYHVFEGKNYYKIHNSKIGFYSSSVKVPPEGTNILSGTKFVSDDEIFAMADESGYYLWIEGANDLPYTSGARIMFVWYDSANNLCMQSILF